MTSVGATAQPAGKAGAPARSGEQGMLFGAPRADAPFAA
jgi:hypothetical protein